jgi:hypothetical protein
MPPLDGPRNTRHWYSRDNPVYPVAAGAVIHPGALVVLRGGYLEPGSEAAGLIAAGRAQQAADNSAGADGDLQVEVRRGVALWENSAGADEITQADVGSDCYIVDDQTVAKTDGTGTRSVAGRIMAVDTEGVWVETF